jgi:branched-chain amino acid transport system permease protein
MDQFVELTILGLATASIYALAASGLVLTYTTTGIFNFAHGAAGMLGAYAYWQLRYGWDWPAPLALLVVIGIGAPAVGAGIERYLMRGLIDAPEIVRLVVTISLLVAMLGIGVLVWSPQTARPVRLLFQGERLNVLGVVVTWHEAIAFLLAAAAALGLRLLLHRTRAGLDMRAAVDSRPLAQLHGARPDRSATLAWAIGTSLAAIAGILIAPLQTMSHVNLTLLIVSAYAAAMIGRLRSFPLTFAGAVLLGLANSYVVGYVPSTNPYLSSFRFALPVVVLFAVLVLLPQPTLRGRSLAASKEDIPLPSRHGALITAVTVVIIAVVLANLLPASDAVRVSRILGIAIIALSLVPLVGFAGQVSLCQMSFAGIGAIVMAHHGTGGDPLAVVYATLLCAVIGALVALPALRLSGIYLALATAAFAVALDRWLFHLPAFDLGPWEIKLFQLGNISVSPVDPPLVDGSSRPTQLVIMAVAFAAVYLLVASIRRSGLGQRMLALKSSPAAAATIGLDVTRVKLGTFALSAGIAGFGGALYAGTIGVVSPERFSFFESLPLLLLTVVGGIGSAAGALFAGIFLGGYPIAVGIWGWLSDLNRILPATMAIALARNPNGAVREITDRYRVLAEVPPALVGLVGTLAVTSALALSGAITGWGMFFLVLASLVVWPQIARTVLARREVGGIDTSAEGDGEAAAPTLATAPEWLGVTAPVTAADVEELDRALGIEEAPR